MDVAVLDEARPGDVPQGEAQPLPVVTCEDWLQHQRECGRLTDASLPDEEYCAKIEERREKWRPEYFATFFACVVAHECSMDDDECAIEALRTSADGLIDIASLDACLQAPSQPCELVYDGIFADCMGRYAECKTDAGYSLFADDRCFTLAALTDARRAQVPSCLALDCSSISECLSDLGTFTY